MQHRIIRSGLIAILGHVSILLGFLFCGSSTFARENIPAYYKDHIARMSHIRQNRPDQKGLQRAISPHLNLAADAIDSLIDVAHLGGWVNGGAIYGNYAFIAQSTYLKVLDLSGPVPVSIASVPLSSEGRRIVYSGGYVYMNYFSWDDAFKDNIEIVNVSDPEQPAYLMTWHFPDIGPNGMKQMRASGNYLYILNSGETSESIVIVDVSNPSSPQVVNTYQQEGQDFVVAGDYLYVVQNGSSHGKLVVLDISDKQNVQQVASVKLANANSIDTDGHYVYIARQSKGGFVVYDVSTPSSPLQVGSYGDGIASYQQVMVRNSRAFLSSYGSGGQILDILDVSTPAQPSLVLQKSFLFYEFIGADAHSLYLAMAGQFQVFDVAQQKIVSMLNVPAAVNDFAASGGASYWVGSKYIWIYDLTDPAAPAFVDTLAVDKPIGCTVHEQQLFVTDLLSQVFVYDISDPMQPQVAGGFDAGSRILKVGFLDGATVLMTSGQLIAVDFSNPASPTELSRQDLPPDGLDFCLSPADSRLFVAYGDGGSSSDVRVIDYSSPTTPTILGSFTVSHVIKRVQVDGQILFVAANQPTISSAYLNAFDVSDIANPQLLRLDVISNQSDIGDMLVNDGTIFITLPVQQQLRSYEWDNATQQFLSGASLADLPMPCLIRSYLPANGGGAFTSSAAVSPQGILDLFLYILNGSAYNWFEGNEGVNIVKVPRKFGMVNLTMNINPPKAAANGCNTTPSPGEHQYQRGTEINLYALPNPDQGWFFIGWSGEASGTDLITQITMDGDKNVTANFAKLELTVSGRIGPEVYCPDIIEDQTFSLDLPFNICASEADGWNLQKISFRASGSGDDQNDVISVQLYRSAQLNKALWTGNYSADDGTIDVTFSPPISIAAGECVHFELIYLFGFVPQTYAYDEVKSFRVESFGVAAVPQNYPAGIISGKAKDDSLTFARVRTTWDVPFAKINDVDKSEFVQDGDTCYVCAGVYRENLELIHPSKSYSIVSLEGKEETFLDLPYPDYWQPSVYISGAAKNVIGFTIERSPVSPGDDREDPKGVNIEGSVDCVIKENTIKGFNLGISGFFSSNLIIRDNLFDDLVGLNLINSDSCVVKGNTFKNDGMMMLSHSNHNKIYQNNIAGGKNDNLNITLSKSRFNRVFNNQLLAPKNANIIQLTDQSNYNKIDHNQNFLLTIKSSEYNTIYYNLTQRIKCVDAFNSSIEDNFVQDNPDDYGVGIVFTEIGSPVYVRNNVIRRNKLSGIATDGGNTFITDNEIYKNGSYGIVSAGQGSGDRIRHNKIYDNFSHGIAISGQSNVEITKNKITNNGETGIYIENSNEVTVLNNNITKNCRGIKVKNSHAVYLKNNHIFNSLCLFTGIDIINSSPLIWGNVISNNNGDGINCQDSSIPDVNNNNIYDNTGYALNNEDASVSFVADDNWWGAAAGPGGSDLNGLVDASSWLAEPVSLVASAAKDTLFVVAEKADSLSLYFQNLLFPDDVIDVSVTDDMGWLAASLDSTLAMSDSLGADMLLHLTIPANAQSGASDWLHYTVVSQTDASDSLSDSLLVQVYGPVLQQIMVRPDSMTLAPGETVRFKATGFDQTGNLMAVAPAWSATGGTIDGAGFFTAGTDTGRFVVIAEEPTTHIKGSATIYISTATDVNVKQAATPMAFRLYQNYPNPFNPTTTIKFAVKERSHVLLKIYNIRGREILTLIDGDYQSGEYATRLDAQSLPSGVYFYRIRMGEFIAMKKMLLLE